MTVARRAPLQWRRQAWRSGAQHRFHRPPRTRAGRDRGPSYLRRVVPVRADHELQPASRDSGHLHPEHADAYPLASRGRDPIDFNT